MKSNYYFQNGVRDHVCPNLFLRTPSGIKNEWYHAVTLNCLGHVFSPLFFDLELIEQVLNVTIFLFRKVTLLHRSSTAEF